jgi:hypothetical protein
MRTVIATLLYATLVLLSLQPVANGADVTPGSDQEKCRQAAERRQEWDARRQQQGEPGVAMGARCFKFIETT